MKGLKDQFGWEIEEKGIQTVEGSNVEDFKALQRSDNGGTIHVHKNSYSVFPNHKIEELAHKLAEISNGKVLGFETFKGGRKVLGFVEPENKEKQVAGDRINDKIVIGNSHDGTSGCFVGTSTIIHRCANMFSSVMKDHVIRHKGDIHFKMEEVLNAYKLYYAEQEKLYKQFEKMKEVEVSPELLESLTKRLFDVDNNEELSTRKENLLQEFNGSLAKEVNEVGHNLWGFFNGVTHYTTHIRQATADNYSEKNSSGHVFGSNADFNRKALKIVDAQMKELQV